METVTERLVLLALDTRHRRLSEAADLRLGYGISAALLLDLLLADALEMREDSRFQPQKQQKLPSAWQRQALAVLPDAPCDAVEAIALFYAHVPRLKGDILRGLAKKKRLREDITPLKWAFAFKSYTLKKGHIGLRKRLLHAVLAGDVALYDSWALRIADACGLIWADSKADKQLLQQARKQLARLQCATGAVQHVTGQLSVALPEAIAHSHKLAPMGKKTGYDHVWEWRGFWPGKGETLLKASERYAPVLERAAFAEMVDEYIIIPGMAENIKCRKAALEIKSPQEAREGMTAFTAKKTYRFPLSPRRVKQLFPEVQVVKKPVEDVAALRRLLKRNRIEATRVKVRKKRLQIKLQSCVKVEFCRLKAKGRDYASVCVEGPDFDVVRAHAHNFQLGKVKEMGYVDFLATCVTEKRK